MSKKKLTLNSLLRTAYDKLVASEKPRKLPCTYDSVEIEYRQAVLDVVKDFDALDLLNANPHLMDQYTQHVSTIRQAVPKAICGSMAFQSYASKFWNFLYEGHQYEILQDVFKQTLSYAQELAELGPINTDVEHDEELFSVDTAAENWEDYQSGKIDTETILSSFDKMTDWLERYPMYTIVPREKKAECIQHGTIINKMGATLSSYIEGNPEKFCAECEEQLSALTRARTL